MARPHRHPKTGFYYFRMAVPRDVRDRLGWELKWSLETKDPDVARARHVAAQAKAHARLAAARGGVTELSHQQIMALAAEWLRRELARQEGNPPNEEEIDWTLDDLESADPSRGGRGYGMVVADDVADLLGDEGLALEERQAERLTELVFWRKVDLLNILRGRLHGDYGTPPALLNAPAWVNPREPEKTTVDFMEVFDGWSRERERPDRTIRSWKRFWTDLFTFLGKTDAAAVTKRDMVSWKEHLMKGSLRHGTINDRLTALQSIFEWGAQNERLTANPAKGVRIKGAEESGRGGWRPYTMEEAATILRASRKETGSLRWAPWLAAFSGARGEEIMALRVCDIGREKGVLFLDINDEARRLKNRQSERKVPLHKAVLAEGFEAYLKGLPKEGRLFPDVGAENQDESRHAAFGKRYGRWLDRLGITGKDKVFHSWRHWFKDQCRLAGLGDDEHDALTGHSSGRVGGRYGDLRNRPVEMAERVNRISTAFLESGEAAEKNEGEKSGTKAA